MMMTYQETIDYLYNSTPVFEHVGASAYKEGLDNTLVLDEHYGYPHQQYKTIHVAGTNGKGSCSHTIASVLQEAGYKVGLYTSPHLVDFRERIKVNGVIISEEEVVEFVEEFIRWNTSCNNCSNLAPQTSHPAPRISPSFFELTTALAFKHFAGQKVDIAVIEVGLGGRLDCTNIITPILSVITNISFDHTGFLGNTLAQIAAEKAGIIKPNVPVVIGEYTDDTRLVFETKAKESGSPICFAQDMPLLGQDVDFELKGYYQAKNKQTILTALKILGPLLPQPLSPLSIKNGLSRIIHNTGLMGRWQTLQQQPLVICDTGHNLGGWQYLIKQITNQECRHLRIVFGMVDDKDIDAVMALLPQRAIYYWTQADNHRAIPADSVATIGNKYHLKGYTYNTVCDAYFAALNDADTDDFIFVGGSSYIVADLLKAIH